VTTRGLQQPADQLQERRLPGAADAQDRDHLAARNVEVDALEDGALPIGETQAADLHQVVGSFH
jgi:hypothetical protein